MIQILEIIVDMNQNIESMLVKKEFKMFSSTFNHTELMDRQKVIESIETNNMVYTLNDVPLVLTKNNDGLKLLCFREAEKDHQYDCLIPSDCIFIMDEDKKIPVIVEVVEETVEEPKPKPKAKKKSTKKKV